MTSVLALLALSNQAVACGGFFCNNEPIEQSAERIVFAIDDDKGTIDTHVQIFYTGTAEEFAWIVPTPNIPELFVSTDTLFNELSWRLAPTFEMYWHEEGRCTYDYSGYGYPESGGYYSDVAASASSSSDGGIRVIEEKRVGPYDTVVLQARSEEALLEWLQDNGYQIPDEVGDVLAPYVSNESYFVALKLLSDRDVGDIAPIGLTYTGTRPMIPIELTSIAASPDMRLETYVFGKSRAVPSNYLHVQINDAAIDWFTAGSNYEEAITRAADEAGGQAFATDYAGSTETLDGSLYNDGRYNTDTLAEITDPIRFMDEIINQGYPTDGPLLSILEDKMPPPAGVDAQDFYNCVECYSELLVGYEFDPVGAAQLIRELIVDPLERAESLFDHDWVSRLTSSVSPEEMTLDPMFVQNTDMGEVDGAFQADLYIMCGDGGSYTESQRRIVLPDGRIIMVPSEQWLWDHDLVYGDLLDDITHHYAKIIEETGETGEPTILFDLVAEGDDLDDWNDAVTWGTPDDARSAEPSGCGCNSGAPGSALGGLGLLALLGFRRRR